MAVMAEEEPRIVRRRTSLVWRPARRMLLRAWRGIGMLAFSSLTRRIIALNLAALLVLVSGILYLNQFREGLTEARVESLLTQGQIIAAAVASSATVENNTFNVDPEKLLNLHAGESISPLDSPIEGIDFPINPERVAPVLRGLISPTHTRARIYDRDGILIIDSRHLYSAGQILAFDLPPLEAKKPGWLDSLWQWVKVQLRGDMPIYTEAGTGNGTVYPEVVNALNGSPSSVVRITEQGELIVSVAVPIQRYRAVLGTLLLSTQGGDIDDIVHKERMGIVRVFLVAALVTILLSIVLAGTIAAPLRRLADAADRVRRGARARPQIPDFSHRRDEIGHLSQALRDMTRSLFNRLDAIESFAADVSHELKNPLTSLKSAVETLPLARSEESKKRLTEIIQHDVRRLNRLITDISDASRLDAELSRQDASPVDLGNLLRTVVSVAAQRVQGTGPQVVLEIADTEPRAYMVSGHDGRLGQVFYNLIDNAISFCRQEGKVRVKLRRLGNSLEAIVEDEGPGIRPGQNERIFERFYTDRPEQEAFGQNSGLGLSITKQIVEAHQGRIWAENRFGPKKSDGEAEVLGARFVVRFPAA
jgi:two-component system sensor histidine kinase ChvG